MTKKLIQSASMPIMIAFVLLWFLLPNSAAALAGNDIQEFRISRTTRASVTRAIQRGDTVELISLFKLANARPELARVFFCPTPLDNRTVLHQAVLAGQVGIVMVLLDIALNCPEFTEIILAPTPDGLTAAHFAARQGNFEILRTLLSSQFAPAFLTLENLDGVNFAMAGNNLADTFKTLLVFFPQAIRLTENNQELARLRIGRLESAVVARDSQKIHALLNENASLDTALLREMLHRLPSFDFAAYYLFVEILNQLRMNTRHPRRVDEIINIIHSRLFPHPMFCAQPIPMQFGN